jgi:hypothetical protein
VVKAAWRCDSGAMGDPAEAGDIEQEGKKISNRLPEEGME